MLVLRKIHRGIGVEWRRGCCLPARWIGVSLLPQTRRQIAADCEPDLKTGTFCHCCRETSRPLGNAGAAAAILDRLQEKLCKKSSLIDTFRRDSLVFCDRGVAGI